MRAMPLNQHQPNQSDPSKQTQQQRQPTLAIRPAGPGLAWVTGIATLALLILAWANAASRDGQGWGDWGFWIGLLAMFVVSLWRATSADASRSERIAVLCIFALAVYLAKVLHSPAEFTFSDEFTHWNATNNILSTAHLFYDNALLPITAYYPGLHLITAAVSELTGLPIFASGLIVLGLGRMVMMATLFLFYEQVGRSGRIAALAALLYAANPNFVFFTAQFAYESMALVLAGVALFALARRANPAERQPTAMFIVAALCLAAVVITHHLTSYILLALLLIWTLVHAGVSVYRQRNSAAGTNTIPTRIMARGPFWALVVMLLALGVWTAGATDFRAYNYIAPNLNSAAAELGRLLSLQGQSRQLFRDYAGGVATPLERFVGIAAVLMIVVILPFGLLQIWRRYRTHSLAMTLAVVAVAYPGAQVLRLTQSGAEAANRSSEFVFLGAAFVMAVAVMSWIKQPVTRQQVQSYKKVALHLGGVALFAGGLIAGWPPWARLPGSYLVSADSRSVSLRTNEAALWANEVLGPGNRIATDRVNRQQMGSYGGQHTVTSYADQVRVAEVFFAPQVDDRAIRLLQRGQVRYLVVDSRLSDGLPYSGVYFERGEPGTFQHTIPFTSTLLTKFEQVPGASLIFNDGFIKIYDVGALTDGQ